MAVLRGNAGAVRCITRDPELPLVASVGLDRWLRVYEEESRESKCRLYLKQQLTSARFAPVTPDDLAAAAKEEAEAKKKAQKQKKSRRHESDDDSEEEDDEEEEEKAPRGKAAASKKGKKALPSSKGKERKRPRAVDSDDD